MLAYFVIAIAIAVSSAEDQYSAYIAPNDTMQCANDLITWCEGMKYPQEGGGLAMVSITISGPDGFFRCLCVSDHDGTNCTRNGSPWFSCSNTNVFFYKGNQLSKNSTVGSDNGTCDTADRAFNDLYVQNLSYDNTTLTTELDKGLEGFFKQITDMQRQIKALQDKIFGGGFLFDIIDVSTPNPGQSVETTLPGNNQLERE